MNQPTDPAPPTDSGRLLSLPSAFDTHSPGPVCDRFEPHTHMADGSIRVPALAAAPAASEAGLDVRRVVQALTNIALRHGVTKDPTPPLSILHVYGYSKATPDMDAEIAAEYARLASEPTVACAADASSCFKADCPKHGLTA